MKLSPLPTPDSFARGPLTGVYVCVEGCSAAALGLQYVCVISTFRYIIPATRLRLFLRCPCLTAVMTTAQIVSDEIM
jgi:hypothetical protein